MQTFFCKLGVRHSLRRGTIIVSRGTDHVPSDLQDYWDLNCVLRPLEVINLKRECRECGEVVRLCEGPKIDATFGPEEED
jgi:hypothetical protein